MQLVEDLKALRTRSVNLTGAFLDNLNAKGNAAMAVQVESMMISTSQHMTRALELLEGEKKDDLDFHVSISMLVAQTDERLNTVERLVSELK